MESGKSQRRVSRNGLTLPVLTLALLSGVSHSAWAGRQYVETFGTDSDHCLRQSPCATIQRALLNAGARSRVIVGPGNYTGRLVIDKPRTSVVSSAGALATILDISEIGLSEPGVWITVDADGARFGQKGKGFTVTGDFGESTGIWSNADHTKIEGNIVRDLDVIGLPEIWTNRGISGGGLGLTVRYNRVEQFDAHGILVTGSGGQSNQASLAKVSGNVIRNTRYACIVILSWGRDNGSYDHNHLEDCGQAGIGLLNDYVGFSPGPIRNSGERIRYNTISGNTEIAIDAWHGNPSIYRNMLIGELEQNCENDQYPAAIQLHQTVGARVRQNIVRGYGSGFLLTAGAEGTQFSANTVIESQCAAVTVEDGAEPFDRFENNNLYGGPTPIDFETVSIGGDIVGRGNFWGNWYTEGDAAPDLAGDPEAAQILANTPELLEFSPKTAPNPIRPAGADLPVLPLVAPYSPGVILR